MSERTWRVLVGGVLSLSSLAAAGATPAELLDEAQTLVVSDPEAATRLLGRVIADPGARPLHARAYALSGVAAAQKNDMTAAARLFEEALLLEPRTSLGFDAGPKISHLFEQVRSRVVLHEPTRPPPQAQALAPTPEKTPPPAPAELEATPPPRAPSLLAPLLLGVAAAALLVTGAALMGDAAMQRNGPPALPTADERAHFEGRTQTQWAVGAAVLAGGGAVALAAVVIRLAL